MTKHYFLIKNEVTNEIEERFTSTWYGEWVGVLWGNLIYLYDSGKYKTHSLVHLAPRPEQCKTYRTSDIERFCKFLGAP